MTHLELREKFFRFWQEKPRRHTAIPSASLIPENDPSTLFTGSGMQPLIPYLLGTPNPSGRRLVDIQKCFRGQDIDEVGDNRHDTYFEMMGNWSLGDYFKKEQLTWYYEFLTEVLGLEKGKLYISCFAGYKNIPEDGESSRIWKSLGIADDHIHFYSAEHNWWSRSGTPEQMPAGEIGGPDSEVYYEFTQIPHDPKYGKRCHPACGCGRFLEIGNSVFIQYQKQEDGSFKDLPQKNVDFGGGIERTLAAILNEPDQFKTDVYIPIIKSIELASDLQYGQESLADRNFRIIADHIKAAVFLISAGVQTSNKDRGYILRRLIRRAIRFSRYLNITESFIEPVSDAVFTVYGGVYPEVLKEKKTIVDALINEERKFQQTLANGLRELEKIAPKGKISASEAFRLYESFGFPYEITREEAQNKGLSVAGKAEFAKEVQKHQEQSRSGSQGKFRGGLADRSEQATKYHTATHLLQAALRQVLGKHVHQQGSNITAERLRFDFSHPGKMTEEQIKKVEDLVNEQIANGLPQVVETMTYEEAIRSGALAFFKERYPEKVTVFSFGDPSTGSGSPFSREICGGPHVKNTKELGQVEIFKEESAGAGIRRIYARLI